MRSEKHKENRRHCGRGDSPAHDLSAAHADRGWFAVLAWVALSVVVFVILFRLGLRAAQARRVTWLVALAGAFCAASRALFLEMRRPLSLGGPWMVCLGALGGLCVAWVLGDADTASLLAGALFGGLLAWLGGCWGRRPPSA